jgi:molybdate transport system permease protein
MLFIYTLPFANSTLLSMVVSIAIYDAVEKLDYTSAHIYSAILFAFSFFILLLVYMFNSSNGINVKR